MKTKLELYNEFFKYFDNIINNGLKKQLNENNKRMV